MQHAYQWIQPTLNSQMQIRKKEKVLAKAKNMGIIIKEEKKLLSHILKLNPWLMIFPSYLSFKIEKVILCATFLCCHYVDVKNKECTCSKGEKKDEWKQKIEKHDGMNNMRKPLSQN